MKIIETLFWLIVVIFAVACDYEFYMISYLEKNPFQ